MAASPAPHEAPLRTTAGIQGTPAMALSAWKGRSGRRYVVGVHELTVTDLADLGACVAIAVTRDGKGIAEPHEVVPLDDDSDATDLIARWQAAGVGEVHVHRLAEGADERRAVVEDLRGGV